jgi:hypothetical protein
MTTPEPSPYDAVAITLTVDEQQVLFMLIAADGSVNRAGSGRVDVDEDERDLFIGVTEDPLFETFISRVPADLFEHAGRYEHPSLEGPRCKLTIIFRLREQEDMATGFEFIYGAESEGPPQEIREMVVSALEITQPWYDQQRQMVAQSEQ